MGGPHCAFCEVGSLTNHKVTLSLQTLCARPTDGLTTRIRVATCRRGHVVSCGSFQHRDRTQATARNVCAIGEWKSERGHHERGSGEVPLDKHNSLTGLAERVLWSVEKECFLWAVVVIPSDHRHGPECCPTVSCSKGDGKVWSGWYRRHMKVTAHAHTGSVAIRAQQPLCD